MNVENLIDSFSEFKEVKNIDRETMMSILEDVFKTVLEKKYDGAEIFDVIINVDKGDLEIWRNREVVADNELEDESYGPGSALEFRGNELEQIKTPSNELINKCTEVIKLFMEVI